MLYVVFFFRIIFEMACSEWWNAHIIPFHTESVPVLLPLADMRFLEPDPVTGKNYPPERQEVAGCPVAILERRVSFPPATVVPMGTFQGQTSENLYVNMMPILVANGEVFMDTLPSCCRQYQLLIQKCLKREYRRSYHSHSAPKVAYLTIDERPVGRGESHRRSGAHVESPGILPLNGLYIPGSEHHWGHGLMMRGEQVKGGIFMASNVSDSCAVWNCHISDPEGDVVGSHGDVRRLNNLLGPPSITLAAGDLVWLTDKTPHESLLLNRDCHRQFFRLVTAEVTSWFANHSTPNPMWSEEEHCEHLEHVNIVRGNKFEITGVGISKWRVGTNEELYAAAETRRFRELFNMHGIGHLTQALCARGINSVGDFIKHKGDDIVSDVITELGGYGGYYYEHPKLQNLIVEVEMELK